MPCLPFNAISPVLALLCFSSVLYAYLHAFHMLWRFIKAVIDTGISTGIDGWMADVTVLHQS